MCAACDGLNGCFLELRRDRLVGPVGHQRSVPGRQDGVADRGREGLVNGLALAATRRAVDRGAHERMAEGNGPVQLHEARMLGRLELNGGVQPELLGRSPNRREIAGLVRRRD